MMLHAPTKGWFMASLIIALVAVFSALSPVPYVTSYGIWVAILAYVVLAVGNLASSWDRSNPSTVCWRVPEAMGRTIWLILAFHRTSGV